MSGKRVALLVNSKAPNLSSGVNDVSHLYALLTDEEVGCCDTSMSNAFFNCESKHELLKWIEEKLEKWEVQNQLIFYYSGHGVMIKDKFSFEFHNKENKVTHLIFDQLVDELTTIYGVQKCIFIIDACHSGAATNFDASKSNYRDFQLPTKLPIGIAYLSSSESEKQRSFENKRTNFSVFSGLLIEGLKTGLNKTRTYNGLIAIDDMGAFINKELKTNPEYKSFNQLAKWKLGNATEKIWLARNKSGEIAPNKSNLTPKGNNTQILGEISKLYDITPFMQHPCPGVNLEDLDWELIHEYFESVRGVSAKQLDEEMILEELNFYSPIPTMGKKALRKDVVICFHKSPTTLIPSLRTRLIVQKKAATINGSASRQIEKILKTIDDNFDFQLIDHTGKRQDGSFIGSDSFFVIREVLSNAFAHRNYEDRGYIYVKANSETIEVTNPGQLYSSWESLLEESKSGGISRPVNDSINEFLYLLKYFEGLGTGFLKIQEYIQKYGKESIVHKKSLNGSVSITVRIKNFNTGKIKDEAKLDTISAPQNPKISPKDSRQALLGASQARFKELMSEGGGFQELSINSDILPKVIIDTSCLPSEPIKSDAYSDETLNERLISSIWATDFPHVLLSGPRGSGKTVSLLNLWASYLNTISLNSPIPIYIPLQELNDFFGKDFIIQYVKKYYADLALDHLLKESKVLEGGEKAPQILFLLDGYDELRAKENGLFSEINELRIKENFPGVQILLSSGIDIRKSFQGKSFTLVELRQLTNEQINNYIKDRIPDNSLLLNTLRNPMVLSIYSGQSELLKKYRGKDYFLENISSLGEVLYQMEVFQKIRIEESNENNLKEIGFQRFILEHLFPFISWRMYQVGVFYIKKNNSDNNEVAIQELLDKGLQTLLTESFFKTFEYFERATLLERLNEEPRRMLNQNIKDVFLSKLSFLIEKSDRYVFFQKEYRAYFAARHIQNQISISIQKKSLPTELSQAPLGFVVRNILGQLEGEHKNKTKWNSERKKWYWTSESFFINNRLSRLLEQCRGVFDESILGYTIWNLLCIWKEQRGELSGANLKEIYFNNFSFIHLITSKQGLSTVFTKGKFLESSFKLQGHSDGINGVSINKDKLLVSCSDDKTIKVWDARSGNLNKTLAGHADKVNSVAISQDGNFAVSCSDDKTIKVWDVQAGTCLKTLDRHSSKINSVAISQDGNFIVSGSDDKTIKVWDTQTGACLKSLEGHTDPIKCITVSQDDKIIASASGGYSWSNEIKIWNAKTGVCIKNLEGHRGEVKCIGISSDGRRLATGYNDKTVVIWDTKKGDILFTLEDHFSSINCVDFSPNNKRLATGSEDNNIKIWDTVTGDCILSINNNFTPVSCLTFSHDGSKVITGSLDRRIKVWDVETGDCILRIEGYYTAIRSTDLSPDGQYIVTGSDDQTIKLWDWTSGVCLKTLLGHTAGINAVKFSNDGQFIASGSDDKTVKLWDVESGSCLKTFYGHLNRVNSIDISPDSKRILSGSDDKVVMEWDVRSEKSLKTLSGHSAQVTCVSYSQDNQYIVTGSMDKNIIVWDGKTGASLETKDGRGEVVDLSISPNGKQIVVGFRKNEAKVWETIGRDWSRFELKDEETNWRSYDAKAHKAQVNSVAHSKKGGRIVTGSEDNTVKFWVASTNSGRLLATFSGHSSPVLCVAISTDGQHVVSGSSDGIIKVWDTGTKKCLTTLPNIPLIIQGCDFQDLNPNSDLSSETIKLIQQYGGVFSQSDEDRWNELQIED